MQQDGQGLCVAAEAEVIVWGSNVRGQLGDGMGGGKWGWAEFPVVITQGPILSPSLADSGSMKPRDRATVVQVAVGHSHNLARMSGTESSMVEDMPCSCTLIGFV